MKTVQFEFSDESYQHFERICEEVGLPKNETVKCALELLKDLLKKEQDGYLIVLAGKTPLSFYLEQWLAQRRNALAREEQ